MKAEKNKNTSQEKYITNFVGFLQNKELKFTQQRRVLCQWIFSTKKHFTADDLVIALLKEKWVSKATIYRTLSLLVEAGLLVEQDFGEGYKTYENVHIKKHHDHLICLNCGNITEFESNEIEKLQEKIAAKQGFILRNHSLKLYGLCSHCQKL